MRDIPFVDAHLHLWDLDRIHYPWLSPSFGDDGPNGSTESIAQNYGIAEYRAEAANWNVVGAVHIEAGAAADKALAETKWLEGLAGEIGLPNGIVAFAALDDPNVEGLLAAHAEHPHVRGIRHIINWHSDPKRTYTPRDVTSDEAWQRGFALLCKYGMSFDLQAYAGQFDTLAKLLARYPDIQVVIDHLGSPVPVDGLEFWKAELAKLAAMPNVAVKLSGAGFIQRPYNTEAARPYVLAAIELFGTDRCMAASNFPTDRLFAGFDLTLDAIANCITDLSIDERRDIWGRNANRIYRLELNL